MENGQVQRIKTEYHSYPQTRYLPLEKADLTKMTAAEKEVIDYELVIYRRPPYSVRVYEEDEQDTI